MRRSDGSTALRSVAQLSGGEWRRLALALSLAFADIAKAHLYTATPRVAFISVRPPRLRKVGSASHFHLRSFRTVSCR